MRPARLAALAGCLVIAIACSSTPPQKSAQTAPAAHPSAKAATTQRRHRETLARATATPVAPATLDPTLTPSPKPTIAIPRRPPDAPPQIVAVQVNSTDVKPGDTLWGKVLTSSNVASVEVRVATYGVGLKKVGVGRFTLAYRMGDVPFFARGTYPLRIIARNTRGDAVEQTLPLTIH